jgi:hypothetical protein
MPHARPLEQAGVAGQLRPVELEQAHPHRFVLGGRERAERKTHQRMPAMGDLAADLLIRQWRKVLLRTKLVKGIHHVACGVEQRAVEVEQHTTDPRTAAPADHGDSPGSDPRGRRRCIK